VEMLKFYAAGDRNKLCQALQSPNKFVMQRHPSSTVVRQYGLPERPLPGYTMKPMTANEVTFEPPFYITATSLDAYIDTVLEDNNPFRCVFSPLCIDDFFDSNIEKTPENEMLLQQIVDDDHLKALLDQLLIVETRTDVKHVYCTMQKYGNHKQKRRKMFCQTSNPLQLIIKTWERIVERKYTRTWAKVLVLKPKKQYKRAGGRKKRGRNNNNNDSDDDDYLAMNVSEIVEVAAAAVRRSKRRKNQSKQRIGQRVAKEFGGEVYYGEVTAFEEELEDSPAQWHILYNDGDEEDLYEGELKKAITLWNKKQNGSADDEE